ncbi:CHAP domain-containing protein [Streptomyces sp. NPDC004528]|uniref:CHAP domain-containing protein n=1 Tax=Streptomyces sp. NPDC004528 TaxID=3154550 RepID=UPI0033B4D99E
MANTSAALVAEAEKWADKHYKEGPKNHTTFGEWYASVVHDPSFAYASWCDEFVSYCAYVTGNADAISRFAYCPSHVVWFKNHGRWHSRYEAAQAGDIVFYDWDGDGVADHVGIVRAYSAPGKAVLTVEGNTSSGTGGSQSNGDGVYERTRSRGTILGFGRPAFATKPGKPAPPAPNKPPVKHYTPPPFPKGLAPNHSKPSARALQRALKAAGWLPRTVPEADAYGPQTQKAVAAFNAKHGFRTAGLTYDPAIGPKGWATLNTLAYSH